MLVKIHSKLFGRYMTYRCNWLWYHLQVTLKNGLTRFSEKWGFCQYPGFRTGLYRHKITSNIKSNFVFALCFLCKCMRNTSILFLCRAIFTSFWCKNLTSFSREDTQVPLFSTQGMGRPHFLNCKYCYAAIETKSCVWIGSIAPIFRENLMKRSIWFEYFHRVFIMIILHFFKL